VTQLAFEVFKLAELHVLNSIPKSIEGFPFEFELGRRMLQELGSFAKGSINPMTHISTSKFVEKVVVEVMQVDKVVELF
jgi:hypothetical protein